jgi:hypothetical protein
LCIINIVSGIVFILACTIFQESSLSPAVDLLLVGRFLVAIRRSGGSLDGDSGAGHVGHDGFSIGG